MAGQTYRTRAYARDCRSNAVSFEDSRAQVECEVGGGCCHQTVTAFPAQRQMMRQICLTTVRTLAAVAVLLLSSCADWVQGKIPMDSDKLHGSLDEMLERTEETTALSAPGQLFVTQGTYPGTILISWKTVPGATSYRVERAVIKSGEVAEPEESDYDVRNAAVYGATTYRDIILSNPTANNEEYSYRYVYRVMAENISEGLESPFTEYTDDSVGWLMPAPQAVEAWKGKSESEIRVTWNEVPKAESYVIYRGESEKGLGMEQLGSVYGNTRQFTDRVSVNEQGEEFYYKVYAKIGAQLSAASSLAMGYSLKAGAPTPPERVWVEDGIGTDEKSITVKWDECSPASEGKITYSLYRTSSVDSVYTLVKSGLEKTEHTDNPGKTNVYYYYYIQVVEIATNKVTGEQDTLKSAFSESGADSKDPAIGCLLSPPSAVEVDDSPAEGKSKLRWTAAIGSERGVAFQYIISYRETQNGTSYPLATGVSGVDEGNGWLSLEVDTKPYYSVTTYNPIVGKQSADSGLAAPVPDAPQNVTASKTMPPANFTDAPANNNGVYPVLITWTAPATGTAPAGYDVYRSSNANSAFRKLTTTPITDLSYIDVNDTAKAGVYYYYKVISLNSLNQGNKGNNPANDPAHNARGYGALTADQWFREYNKTTLNSQTKLTLMHKPNNLDKVGSETISGDISGTLGYTAKVQGFGARITMPYTDYADFYVTGTEEIYFKLNGNTNTTSDMSANGSMDGTVVCTGMYPGTAGYDAIEIKGGGAGGGYYVVTTTDLGGNVIFDAAHVDWLVGEER